MLVLASPVYCFDFSAQIKLVIDRMYTNLVRPFPIKECALLLVCGNQDISVADGAVITCKAIIDYSRRQYLGIILEGGVYDKGEIVGKNAIAKAKILGNSIR